MSDHTKSLGKYAYYGALFIIGLLALACFADPDEDDLNGDSNYGPNGSITELSGSITDDQTWSGTIEVTGNVSIRSGAVITIEAGTTFIMAPDTQIEFGWNAHNYTIYADGTEEEPIVFRGRDQVPGFWKGIYLRQNGTSDSYVNHVEIHHAGGDGNQQALLQDARLTVNHITVTESASDGVRAGNFRDGSTTLIVEGCDGHPVVLTSPEALDNLPLEGSDFTGNGDDRIALDFSTIQTDITVGNPGVPYFIKEGWSARGGGKLTVDAGNVFEVAVDQLVEFGWNGHEFTIELNGTEEEPIVFEGAASDAGYWRGIRVQQAVTTASTIDHVIVRDAGAPESMAFHVRSPIRLNELTLENSLGTAFELSDAGLHHDSAGLHINTTQGLAARAHFEGAIDLPSGTYFGNDDNFIALHGNLTRTGTLIDLGAPYLVEANITTRSGAELTIEPGTHFYFGADRGLEFGWNGHDSTVTAIGTAADPIVFAGLIENAGSWSGVRVRNSVASNSVFEHVEFHHADTALDLHRDLSVADCSFYDYLTAAIALPSAADPAPYLANNSFDGSGADDIVQ